MKNDEFSGAGAEESTHRLKALDGLRGLAAFGVVFWHYQSFGGDGATYPGVKFWATSWLYTRGWLLVDLFFLLSGIVMTFKYLEPVAKHDLAARDFFILRFSRVYPLHFVTLCICAGLQWYSMATHRPQLIYANNDLHHFVVNLFFIQSPVFVDSFSFNGPSWSVSAEVFVYLLFFVVARRWGHKYILAGSIAILLALALEQARPPLPFFNNHMTRAVTGFFLGSLLYLGVRRLIAKGYGLHAGLSCLAILAVIVGMVRLIGYDGFVGGMGFANTWQPHALVIFPLVVVATLTVPVFSKILSTRPLSFLGDISYAIYLLHVPLQLVFLSVLRAMGKAPAVERPVFLLSFLAVLVSVSALTYWLLEVPARRYLRRRLR